MSTYVDQVQIGNKVLDSLPSPVRERLVGSAASREMPAWECVYQANEPITEVHFPLTGVMAVVSALQGGTTVEVAKVGNEGMVGMPVYLGLRQTQLETVAQVSGEVIPVPSDVFREELRQSEELRVIMDRYAYAFMYQMAQSGVCNAVHCIEQRVCRWLLMTNDRVQTGRYRLTQEMLAAMLGVRAASISDAASNLQRKGLITYHRGQVTILDRVGLEREACECYWLIQHEYAHDLGPW